MGGSAKLVLVYEWLCPICGALNRIPRVAYKPEARAAREILGFGPREALEPGTLDLLVERLPVEAGCGCCHGATSLEPPAGWVAGDLDG